MSAHNVPAGAPLWEQVKPRLAGLVSKKLLVTHHALLILSVLGWRGIITGEVLAGSIVAIVIGHAGADAAITRKVAGGAGRE